MRPVMTSTLGRCVARIEVDSRRARLLREARDQLLDLLADHHHQVGELVDDDDDERQPLERLGILGREAERVGDVLALLGRLGELLVVARDVANAEPAHQLVAPLHLADAPVERVGGLLHVGDDRAEQVRDPFVDAHLEHLRIDQDEPHVARLGLVEERQDHRVDADRLARSRCAGHQTMRHLLQVGDDGNADDVLAEAERELRSGIGVGLRAEHLREADRLPLRVGQLERHRRLAGNRLDDADRDQPERAREVLGEAHDLRRP